MCKYLLSLFSTMLNFLLRHTQHLFLTGLNIGNYLSKNIQVTLGSFSNILFLGEVFGREVPPGAVSSNRFYLCFGYYLFLKFWSSPHWFLPSHQWFPLLPGSWFRPVSTLLGIDIQHSSGNYILLLDWVV